jgi:predicted ribosome quality control (RQC) complex YloA/Tae2 family protein
MTETLIVDVVGLAGREFTSFDVAAVVRELNDVIVDSIVNNVYQLDGKTILLKLHKPDKAPFCLVLEAGKRINLTAYASEKPRRPPAFCMALRKFLRSARLLKVEQYEFERVVVLSFKTYEGTMQLILELFGEGNIILLSEKGIILQAMTYKRMRDRNILRGEPFKFAPSIGKNPSKVNDDETAAGLKASGDTQVVRAITRLLSIGGTLAEEVLARAGVEKTRPVTQLGNEEIATTLRTLRALLLQVNVGVLEPHVVMDENGDLVDAAPLKLKRYENTRFKVQAYNTFNEALDEFYSKLSALDQATKHTNIAELETEAARLERIIAEQQKTVAYADTEAERLKHSGDLIYAHFSDLQVLLDRFLDEKKLGRKWHDAVTQVLDEKQRGLMPSLLFESFIDNEIAIRVSIEGEAFNLALQKSLFESAAEFYEQSKRTKQKAEGARTALKEYLKKLQEVQTKIAEAEELERVKPAEVMEELEKRKVRQKEWFEKFRWFVSSEDLMVVAGKDAVTNEVLIKKYAEPNDVVFHADIVGAPFVVIKTEGRVPGQQSLAEAGEFAAAFSRAWREGFASVDVFWVKPGQLSKGGPSGESVGHGAFVVRGERNWMRGTPLRIAIGVVFEQEAGKAEIVGGPVGSVKRKTDSYVVIVPGDLSAKELSRLILRKLTEKVPGNMRKAISNLSFEAIREFVPYSKANVMKE